ncbi:Ferrous-iron efflux pump FieF [bioreactor metagenome]|jgi:cation diffusion facilitator family transporter|uniref:Ferrous-iron efflux pump FieF n=1 Tax=bioreactor metagenome TaxID=1076179 RepID=A0A644UIE9_9ZZZZ|nr:cation diffusion facilitator family transporter [Spirochaetales bacterium]
MDAEKRRLGYREGVISSVLNTVLFGLKFWVGTAVGSVAMIADAWHTLSDTLTSLVVILGFWISSKPKDDEHPFGHGRAELIASVIIGTLLGVVGVNFLKESWNQLGEHQAVEYSTISIIVFGISVAGKEALARYSIWAGRKVNAQSLLADGWHHRSDALASALIIVGALFGARFWWIDGVLGMGVSALILYAAVDIIRGAVNTLMGEKPDAELIDKVRAIVDSTLPGSSKLHHIHLHTYGDQKEMTLHIRLPAQMSLHDAHSITFAIEDRIRKELNIEATIHPEPERRS